MSAPPRPNPLRSSRDFRRLWLARTISHIGDGIALVALVLLVQGSGGSGAKVGILLLAQSIPRLFGPFAGALADRVEQRALMVTCDLGQAVIFAAIAWQLPPFPALLALVAATATLDTIFGPAGRSAVPALVHPEDLVRANAWMGTSLNIQVAVGPILGGALVTAFGARGAIGANALSFVLSAVTLVGLPPLRADAQGERRGFLAVGREGIAYAWRNRAVRGIVLALFLGVAFAAVDNVALVFLVRETLGGGPLAFGLVTAAYGVGMIAASAGLTWRHTAVTAGTLFVVGWLASGIGTLLTGLAPLLVVVAAAQAIAGMGNAVENIAGDTLIQRVVPRAMLGRTFGLYTTAAFGGSTLAYAAGGFLLDATSPRAVFLIGGAGVLAVFVFLALFLRRELGASLDPSAP